MTEEEKITVCLLRLNHKNIYDIAETIGMTSQGIHNFLANLPGVKGECTTPPITDSLAKRVITYYFLGYTTLEISDRLDLYPGEVIDVFSALKTKKNPAIRSKYYPAVTEWMKENGYTIKEFGQAIGVHPNKLSAILRGEYRNHMTCKVAQKIKDFTGLSMRKIYAVQLRKEEKR